ncbi:hypothetical protein BO86DRAFT_393744 [Aspergillus japonicus CBS 114.51]|uniref:Uncharacterized protein n=2 Tax=Aspergillus TaxID=5052 RepID=A0A2V5HF50_ASPV1|nr:hypothetical protein BO86DRAFT_393744 [Aspergillus japonicus CBS 114.51]PYI22999.1 hypothetical protein BO99DRAFT_399365 [Aspergillus violaceofuscus CBS 115571]RAH76042.1 hypothetical protein BO86DRAFT_393744 [Aspergillus japonicus CBS 114.51]
MPPSASIHRTFGATTTDPNSKRRRFQPPITSFFTTASDPTAHPSPTAHHTHNHYSTSTSSPTPTLAPKVQASLLSVGMRIRKSIAEGYKTHHQSSKALLYGAPPFYHYHQDQDQDPSGHLVTTDEGDAFSLPASSQESTSSSAPFTGTKRGRGDFDSYRADSNESDSEMEDFPGAETWGQRTSRAEPAAAAAAAAAAAVPGRTILAPRSKNSSTLRRRFVVTGRGGACTADVGLGPDFEEPAFLRSREEVDGYEFDGSLGACREVEMGGV